MTQTSAEPTANEIRRVALELFSARGYDGTSVRDISDSVGIRKSSMYNHFPSKEAILWELTSQAFTELHEAWATAAQQLPGNATPLERLSAFVRSDVRFHALHRKEASIINAHFTSLNADHLARAIEWRAAYEATLTAIVHDCVGSRRAADPRTRLTVYAILEMCLAVAGWYRPDGPLDIEDICSTYAEMAHKLVA